MKEVSLAIDYLRFTIDYCLWKSKGDILVFAFLACSMDKSKKSVMPSDKKKRITLTVNGEERVITSDPQRPLLDAIRDDMRESSVQFRCGQGRCGGCVVLLDGKRVLSCDITIARADKRSVTII